MLSASHCVACRTKRVQINKLLKKYTKVYLPGCKVDLGATLTRKNLHSEELGEAKSEKVFNELCLVDKHSAKTGKSNYKIPKAEVEAPLLSPFSDCCNCSQGQGLGSL